MTKMNEQARTINAAGVALLSDLDKENSSSSSTNLFLSPPSIVAALSLALAAAEPGSKCEQELRGALVPSSCGSAEEALASVAGLCSSVVAGSSSSSSPASSSPASSSPVVEAANSVWCAGGYDFSEAYLASLSGLKAEAKKLTEGGAKAINAWVSSKTRGKIDAIIDETTAASATAILVNAMYFKGQWKNKFDPKLSGPGEFEIEKGKKVQAHFMNKLFKRGSGSSARKAQVFRKEGVVSLAIKLPYASISSSSNNEGGERGEGEEKKDADDLFDAVFALPEPGVPFSEALAALQESGEEAEKNEGKWQDPPRAGLDVSVPAFKVEGACLKLAPLLRSSLGLSAPFSQTTCEFTRMFSEGKTAPAIEEVLHKVCVECDEEGSEAAAATAVVRAFDVLLLFFVFRTFFFFVVKPTSSPSLTSSLALSLSLFPSALFFFSSSPPLFQVMMRAMLAVEEPLRFCADRPFLFCVRHAATGLDLFAGRVAVPRSWQGEKVKESGGKVEGYGEPGVRPGGAPVVLG